MANETREGLKSRLEQLGHPTGYAEWFEDNPDCDYVARLGLTHDDVPELIELAARWADPTWEAGEDADDTVFFPVHAWRCLAQLRATEAIGPLLEMMDPLDDMADDWSMEEFPDVFARIGPEVLGPLGEYLDDAGRRDFPRITTIEGLVRLAQARPELRDDVVDRLSRALERFADNSHRLNAFLVNSLIEMKATEAAELIERAFAADRIDTGEFGKWDDARQELGVEGLGLVPDDLRPYNSLRATFRRMFAINEAAGHLPLGGREPAPPADDLDAPILGPADRLYAGPKVGRNDPCPCGSGKKYKHCCGR